MRRGVQGAAVVLGVHHGHVGAAVLQHLLHAVYTAALAACADRGAGDRVVAAQAVHLAAGCFAVLHVRINTFSCTDFLQKNTQDPCNCAQINKLANTSMCVFIIHMSMLTLIHIGLTKSLQISPLECVYIIDKRKSNCTAVRCTTQFS